MQKFVKVASRKFYIAYVVYWMAVVPFGSTCVARWGAQPVFMARCSTTDKLQTTLYGYLFFNFFIFLIKIWFIDWEPFLF